MEYLKIEIRDARKRFSNAYVYRSGHSLSFRVNCERIGGWIL